MPLRVISSSDAVENVRHNLFGEIPRRDVPDANRIEPICKPAFTPGFQIEFGDRIFAIGSSFARHIERALFHRGYDIATSTVTWPDDAINTIGIEALNNYSVASIENEFRWALDSDHPFDPEKQFLEIAPGRFIDPNIGRHYAFPLERMTAYRKAVTEVTRRVTDCRIVIMTLDFGEVWFDTLNQCYLNHEPPRSMMAKAPERFQLHILDFADTLASLERTIGLLKRHCRQDQRILLIVSPVPLATTHTENDAIVANCYSKSVLRAAAEHIATQHGHVDYYPSYESVTLSERSVAWAEDQVHVTRELVDVNVERMIEAYSPTSRIAELADIAAALTEANEHIQMRNPLGAIRCLEPTRDSAHLDPSAAHLYIDCCLRVGRLKDALAVLAKLPPAADDDRQRRFIDARIKLLDGRTAEGIAELNALMERFPKWGIPPRTLAEALIEAERWDDALAATIRWNLLKAGGERWDAVARIAYIHAKRGDDAQAEAAYRKALDIRKGACSTSIEFAEFLIERKRFSEAASILREAIPETKAAQQRVTQLLQMLPSRQSRPSHLRRLLLMVRSRSGGS